MDAVRFSDLDLNENILKAIDDMGFEEPSRIQAEVIPVLLQGYDAIGQAQTGTGKTLAFGAPILNNMSRTGEINSLILTPTRELAVQVNDELVRIAKYTNARLLPVYGGQPIERQIRAIKRGVDIIVGTPGRVLDLIRRKVIVLKYINFLILDEGDEMLDMGFIGDIEAIIKASNKERQTMFFSATMPAPIKKLAKRYMKPDAKHISVVTNVMTVPTVSQYYFEIKHRDRFESLCRILDVDEPASSIIFCRTKRGVDELAQALQARGYNVEGMHGDMNQNQRLQTLKRFRDGSVEFLIATDVAARGIDVDDVSHVINYELPQDTESYVHRIGRTGRANKEGIAYTLVTSKEYPLLKQIEKSTKSKIKRKEIPTVEDIFHSKYDSIVNRVKESLENDDYKKFIPLVSQLDDDYSLLDISAALMNIAYGKEISYDYSKNDISHSNQYTRLFISVGEMDRLKPKVLLGFLCSNAQISSDSIGDIDIMKKFSFVNVNKDVVEPILRFCSGKKLSGRKATIQISKPRNA
ncbi:MAG: DEAD/DEAH box helicase [Caldicoprobacterales bacterium]|nr:DEAD/DEAH box helicase [Clostridiales bacterium]